MSDGVGSPGGFRDELSVALCQLTSVDDVDANLSQIMSLLRSLENDPPKLVCFPENALYFRIREGAVIPGLTLDNEAIRELSVWAEKFRSTLHLGSVPLRRSENPDRLYNSSVLLTPDGAILDNYQKMHLFDVDVEGHKPVRESDVFAPGRHPAVFEVDGWKIGSTICYDLRFSELYLHYAKLGVDAILVPSAFLVPTGRAHWDVLIRARAIECQAYVLAAAQGGEHRAFGDANSSPAVRSTYGHSMIVDPWGVIVEPVGESSIENAPRVLRATLRRERIQQVRRQIPIGKSRRGN